MTFSGVRLDTHRGPSDIDQTTGCLIELGLSSALGSTDSMLERKMIDSGSELVIGVVGAIGTDVENVVEDLRTALRESSYKTRVIRVIELLHDLEPWKDLPHSPEDERYKSHIDAAAKFCHGIGTADALARFAIGKIKTCRGGISGSATKPADGCAYILRSLKRPEEVELLREVYDKAFILVAAYSPRTVRVENLAEKIAESHHDFDTDQHWSKAVELVVRDEMEGTRFGQNVRGTFHEADVFIDSTRAGERQRTIERFVELVLQHPFFTPSRDEYCMFHAQGAALRSADLSRQVGAVIATKNGDIVAMGTNEVPKAGGGLYWEGDSNDSRDFQKDTNTSFQLRRRTLADALNRLKGLGWLREEYDAQDTSGLIDEALGLMGSSDQTADPENSLRESRVMDALEYGRTVHAEMAAITEAVRLGVSVAGCTLYCTTFPCHECARHIVASGIDRVVYIQPYPKSMAEELFEDSITVDDPDACHGKVRFEPFVGIAPRQYFSLFKMIDRADQGGRIMDPVDRESVPRFRIHSSSYLPAETTVFAKLSDKMEEEGFIPRE